MDMDECLYDSTISMCSMYTTVHNSLTATCSKRKNTQDTLTLHQTLNTDAVPVTTYKSYCKFNGIKRGVMSA